MKVLACSVDWQVSGGTPFCPGTTFNTEAPESQPGISIDDAQEFTGHALELFAIVAAALLIRKAIK
jgi:hypothetical protein